MGSIENISPKDTVLATKANSPLDAGGTERNQAPAQTAFCKPT